MSLLAFAAHELRRLRRLDSMYAARSSVPVYYHLCFMRGNQLIAATEACKWFHVQHTHAKRYINSRKHSPLPSTEDV